jgi:hypothetical protein
MLIRRSQEMRHISRAMTEVTLRLAEPEGVSTDAIVSVGQAIRREVAALGDGIERAVARASELESMVRSEVATLERAYDENENRVRSLIGELHGERDSILEHSGRLRDAISNAHEAFSFDVQNVADRVAASLDNVTGRITDNILMRAEEARAQLHESGNTIVESLSDKSAEATQRLTEVGVQIAKAIADRNEKVSEELKQSTADMHAKLAERAAGISQMIAQSGQTFENTIGQQLQSLADSVATRGNEIANRISADSGALSQTMAESVQTFETSVKVYGGNVLNEMKAAITGVTEASRDSLSALDEKVATKIGEVSEQIDQRIARIETTLSERTSSLNETLANRTLEFSKTITEGSKAATDELASRTQELSRTITEGSKAATEAVEQSVTGMGEYFSAKTAEMAATLSERASKIDETLGNRAMQLTETLDTRVNKFEELIVSRLENVTNSIEQRSIASTDLLVERVNAVNEHLRGTAEQIEQRIGDTSSQVEKNLTQLADGITKNFIERVNNITGAHETLRSEVRDIIAELGQTHGLLQAAIDTASSTLGPIEGKVAEKVTAFHNTLESVINATRSTAERMDHQIRELNDSSSGVLRDVSNLALRFEEQVRLVAQTSESLNKTHERIDTGLALRRDAIDHISNTLSERTNELEERLTRFNRMLEETFSHAQGKAQDVARIVADTTATATQSIARQYELIRSSSSEERERTNVALKDTYDEAMQSVNAMFSEANARFLEASRDLREISEDIHRTLDTTREEIRRTVFELPTETKESANAMRRVVADQIKALSELNDIVARHGRGVEQGAISYEYREAEMAAVGGRSAPRNALPRPQMDDGGDLPPPPPPARREPPAPEPRQPERKVVDRSARFGEALNKKLPQPEPEAEDTSTGIESLDSLSIDIARMIDHEAAAESWERFKRGERGVFNRRLYTNAGQKTFEEIRKKYRRNADFRETVDRYIDEFEKLLEQVSRDERGQALTKTYLTSDTGKVYTLLAHAAGRLG